MKRTTFLLGALLIFSACNRDKKIPVTTEVDGYLVVLGTNDIIKDRPYKIILRDRRGKKVYDETYTDENGYYKLSHESSIHKIDSWAEHEYVVRMDDNVPPDGTFNGTTRMIFEDVSFFSGFKGKVNLGMEKKAWVELHVKNVDPHVWDYIRITYRNQLLGEFYHDQDFKLILEGTGNWRNMLDYTVKVNDDEYVGKTDWIYLGEMDTTYFKLEY